jgi:hypothetical protein
MARQYKAFSVQVHNQNLIVYPVLDESPLTDVFQNQAEIIEHLNSLYKNNPNIQKGQYHIVFVWNLERQRMTDVWVHLLNEYSDSGPILECYTFRGMMPCQDAGIASGDSIIALAREEELRRKCANLEIYLNRKEIQAEFPQGLQPDQDFRI